ncbi:MAG: hypothetical protein ACLSA6_19505 [Holdemania massiliensis]
MDEVYGNWQDEAAGTALQQQLCAQKIQLIDKLEGQRAEAERNEMRALFYEVEMPLASVLYKWKKKAFDRWADAG